jgi:hypothetical protein
MFQEETLQEIGNKQYEEAEGEFLELIKAGRNSITVLTRVDSDKAAAPFEPEDHTVGSLRDELEQRNLSEAELDLLLEAEEQGKDRSTAKSAIKDKK